MPSRTVHLNISRKEQRELDSLASRFESEIEAERRRIHSQAVERASLERRPLEENRKAMRQFRGRAVTGEIRLIAVNRAFERSTMAVTVGVSRDGMIGLIDAEALVVAGKPLAMARRLPTRGPAPARRSAGRRVRLELVPRRPIATRLEEIGNLALRECQSPQLFNLTFIIRHVRSRLSAAAFTSTQSSAANLTSGNTKRTVGRCGNQSRAMIGELRPIGVNRAFERSTMAVPAGVSRDGMIGLVEAENLVTANEAAWIWRDDGQLEAARRQS